MAKSFSYYKHAVLGNLKAYLGLDYIFTYPPDSQFGVLVDNIHKHPVVSKLLCRIGRHDFQYIQTYNPGVALLECFYCKKQHSSHRPNYPGIKMDKPFDVSGLHNINGGDDRT